MKRCSKCRIEKELSEFDKDKNRKDGLNVWCKNCKSDHAKLYRKNNKEKMSERSKKYYQNNSEYIKQYYKDNKEKILQYHKQYNKNNEQKIKQYNKDNNEHQKQYRQYYKEQRNNLNKQRKKNDINYKLACSLRSRLCQAIKNNQKVGSAVRDLGCTIEELKIHLEKQFKPGMTWDNWETNGWHIDHIVPLSSLDLTDREQFLKACHYTNLQPLWAEENFRKHNKLLDNI